MGDMPHKLLLADDSVTIQRVIELTFADEDVQVIAVGNGQDAIDRVQHDRPDIVLADVGMPERNGYEVAAFVKGNPDTAHIPVVLLTGAFEPIDEGRARTVGCDGVLVKPFEPQLVISRVKDLLAGKQPAGMWTGAPAAQGPVRQAASELDLRTPAPAPAAAQRSSNDPLEAYFDQLDAAFSSPSASAAPVGSGDPFAALTRPQPSAPLPLAQPKREGIPVARHPAPAAESGDPLSTWDPELAGDPARPASIDLVEAMHRVVSAPPPAPVPVPVRADAPAPVPVAAPAPVPVAPAMPASLVDAFTALLEAEQKMGLTPSAAAVPIPAPPAPVAPEITDETIEDITARVLRRLTGESRPAIHDVAERLVREEIERIKHAGNL